MQDRFETFTVLINRISRNIRRIKNQEMADYGLRGAQVSCLYYLYLTDGLTAGELCERCEEDKATVSRALEFLETNGYIVCRSKNVKRYKSPLLLTEKGEEAGEKVAEKIDRVIGEVSSFGDEDRSVFYRCLGIISAGLENIAKNE